MKKIMLLLSLVLAANNAFAALPQKKCIDSTSGIANLISTVLYGRCTGRSDEDIRKSLDAAIVSNRFQLQLTGDDYVRVLNAGAGTDSQQLPICIKIGNEISSLDSHEKELAAKYSPERVAASMKKCEEDFAALKNRGEKNTQTAKSKIENSRAKFDKTQINSDKRLAVVESIGKVQTDVAKDLYEGCRRLVESQNLPAAHLMSSDLEHMRKEYLRIQVYSSGYVAICKNEPIDVSDDTGFYYNSLFVKKMIELAVGPMFSAKQEFLNDQQWEKDHAKK